ncbi:MAG: hypothetical protein Q7S42_04685 [Candidatus Omnitrophota bacterium]|nr:hypothetical protein [Candidatus Omnitrophota bacterium]
MRYKYSVSTDNLLVITISGQKPLKPKGNFQINQDNQLEFWLNEPQNWRRIYSLPGKIVFEGNWNLNSNHDLELTLNKTGNQSEASRLTLKGQIISAQDNVLAFEIITHTEGGGSRREPSPSTFSILKLAGIWQVDEVNRLGFQVSKKVTPDTLIFKATWLVNKNQQIEYIYEKINLATKSKTNQSLTFEGYWKIDSAHRLVYVLSRNSDSQLAFRVYLDNPNIYPQQNAIKYRLGIGFSQSKSSNYKIVTLYGQWKFNRNLGLIFSMDYGEGKVQEVEFGAEVTFEHNKLNFSLKNTEGRPLGVTLTYTYKMFNSFQPQAFIRLKSYQKQLGIEAGLSVPF